MLNRKIVKWLGAGVLSVAMLTASPALAAKAPAKSDSKKPATLTAHVVKKTSSTGKKLGSTKRHSKKHLTSSKNSKHASKKHTKTVSLKSKAKGKDTTTTPKKSKHA